ncbi:anti-sigma B factor RsbW [Brevibacillus dissolubilis]|uniref:anti-sigma B factor RsbW n=1 Tax=Brevibacillus dissolubilis TaxID=1844116 RepID=UPI00111760B8|nr:anti-sigma B factor RsbW [Brevibacillus dissolubilis]
MIQTTKRIRITIPADAEFIDVVRLSLYGLATRMGFSFEEIEDMKVAVSEACNNVILHAYTQPDEGEIELTFTPHVDRLVISVRDQGTSFNFEQTVKGVEPLHDKEIHELKAGGLGIYMMQALMDEVVVHSGAGTEVILTKLLSHQGGKTHASEANHLSGDIHG